MRKSIKSSKFQSTKNNIGAKRDDDDDNNNMENEKTKQLLSNEVLRESPIEWPENVPDLNDLLKINENDTNTNMPNLDLTPEEKQQLNELNSLSPNALLMKINELYQEIFQLGLREAKEMKRGKILGILNRRDD